MPLSEQYKDLRFEALFNSASMGIIVVNATGDIVMSNKYANQLFGYNVDEIVSEKLEKFQPRSFNMGISKQAFLASQGFGNIHPGEDPDLSIRLWKMDIKLDYLLKHSFIIKEE